MIESIAQGIDDRSVRTWTVIAVAWLAVGALAGGAEILAARLGGQAAQAGAVVAPLAAGLCWIPLTLLAATIARRWPLAREAAAPAWIANALAVAAASFLLNLLWAVLLAGFGEFTRPMLRVALAGGVRWWHVNALVFALVLGGFHGLAAHRRKDRAPADAFARALSFPAPGRDVILPVDDIDWIGGAGDYSAVHAGERELLVNERLKELERRLDPSRFVRIHRSAIVNLDRVREARPLGRGDRELRLESGTTLRVARRRRLALEQALATRAGDAASA